MSVARIPTEPGFYWAQWRIADDDSSTDGVPPVGTWEVVEVFINGPDREEPEYLMASVSGEAKPQSIENFVWGAGPLVRPQ